MLLELSTEDIRAWVFVDTSITEMYRRRSGRLVASAIAAGQVDGEEGRQGQPLRSWGGVLIAWGLSEAMGFAKPPQGYAGYQSTKWGKGS